MRPSKTWLKRLVFLQEQIRVCLKMLCTLNPMVNDHYPYKMAISLGILTQHFQTNPFFGNSIFVFSASLARAEVLGPSPWILRFFCVVIGL